MFRGVTKLLAVLVGLAVGLAAATGRADVPISDKAKRHFRIGVELLDDPDGARYEEAYRAFKAAYKASPSPKILGNLGLCAMKLEKDAEAIASFERYIAEVDDIRPSERKRIETDLEVLKTNVVTVSLSFIGSTDEIQVVDRRIPVAGDPVINRYRGKGELDLGVRPGHHQVTAKRGDTELSWEFDATPGDELSHTFDFSTSEQAPNPDGEEMHRPVPVAFWAMLATTAAIGIGAGVTGGLAISKNSEYEGLFDDTGNVSDPARAEELQSEGKTLNIVTDVLIATTAVSAVVTLVIILARPEVPVEEDEEEAALLLSPIFGPNTIGLGLSGAF